MTRIRPALALACLLLTSACAAVPAERLGTVPPRSPVTAQEAAKAYPIDVYDPLEGLNRRVYRFNTNFDRWVFLPVPAATSAWCPTRCGRAWRTSSATSASSGTG